MLKPHVERAARLANTAVRKTAIGWLCLLFASLPVIPLSTFVTEGLPAPGPTVPDPGTLPASALPPAEARSTASMERMTATLRVHPKDADRIQRTLALDIANHGGHALPHNRWHTRVFTVPRPYIDRITPMFEQPESGKLNEAYTRWTDTVLPEKDPSLRQLPPDTLLTVHLSYPLAAHPATLPLMAISATVAGLSAIAILICMLIHGSIGSDPRYRAKPTPTPR